MSETHAAPGSPHRARVAQLSAPVLLALACVVTSGVIDLATPASAYEVMHTSPSVTSALTGLMLVAAGVVVLHHRPRHRVGLALLWFGIGWAVDGVFEAWSNLTLGTGDPRLFSELTFWLTARAGAFLLLGLPVLLLLFPTGRLMPGRWGTASRAALVASLALPVTLLVTPIGSAYDARGDVPDIIDIDRWALPVPDDVATWLLVGGRLVTFVSLLVPLAVVVVRHRRADGLARRQLRWLLWAALVCGLSVVVSIALPATGVAYAALVVALGATSASVTIGIVRPDLLDIDTLIGGTVVYAAVAGVVVLIDLAVVGLASRQLGGRFSEQDIAVLVIVLAVAVYAPVRHYLWILVRRLLAGQRGDRYEVVSTLAARLERSEVIEDQLPAIATAVAAAFKLRYVSVEVFRPGNDTVVAEHGTRSEETTSLAISYRDEQVGRLVLPRRGWRARLSHRDETLLADVVRQAAVAVRSNDLAAQLQDSRERLVLGREDDRRRIRRDLHDGLGPVLGGVALRLDAARNAVDADPERSRTLIRQARQEITAALEDVRRLVHDLRPPALDDLGLLAAIEQQVERARHTPLEVRVDTDTLDGLPAAVEVAAYRIVSEGLNNVVRHASATTCEVRFVRDPSLLRVEIRDDGVGIGEDVTAGVGLLSLRERADELGGTCEVLCPADGGTQVVASLPITRGAVR